MKICENGVIRDMTTEEITAIVVAARNRSRAKLKTTQKSQEVQSDKCFI